MLVVRSAAVAAKARNRGPSVLERRATEERQAAAAADAAAQKKRSSRGYLAAKDGAHQLCASSGRGLCVLGRGRAALNAPLQIGGAAPAMEHRKQTLMQKAECRRSSDITPLAPAGAGNLDEMPERDEFVNSAEWEDKFFEFVLKNFSSSGGQGRAVDLHERCTGLFGEWHKRNQHGDIVEWKKEENGYRLEMLVIKGKPKLPSVASVMQFAMQARLA